MSSLLDRRRSRADVLLCGMLADKVLVASCLCLRPLDPPHQAQRALRQQQRRFSFLLYSPEAHKIHAVRSCIETHTTKRCTKMLSKQSLSSTPCKATCTLHDGFKGLAAANQPSFLCVIGGADRHVSYSMSNRDRQSNCLP